MASPLSLFGLILDIAGAFALAQAFMFKGLHQQRIETETYYDFNPVAVVSLAEQRIDAWVGFGLLAAGFLGQAGGLITWHAQCGYYVAAACIASGLSAFLLFALRRWLRPWSVRKAIEHRLRNEAAAEAWYEFTTTLAAMARVRGLDVSEGTIPNDLGRALLGDGAWETLLSEAHVQTNAVMLPLVELQVRRVPEA